MSEPTAAPTPPTPPAPAGTGASAGNNGAHAAGGSSGGAGTSTLRREILVHLRRSGPASPDGIASALGASRSGVTQQLHALELAGLVARTAVRHGVGRPRHLYDVTPDAQGLFPTNYDGLATGLLAAILEVGGEQLLEEIFQARRRQAEARTRERLEASLGPDASLEDRVVALAGIQDELGYLAEVQHENGALRLVEHNCAVLHVARGNPAACQAELDLFTALLGTRVVRETHIRSGDRCCSYRVDAAEA
jgi:predicted ArsR family transcriptional regulator